MRIAIVGANGQVGQALREAFDDCSPVALTRDRCDIDDRGSVARAIATARPDVVISAAAYTNVNAAERDSEQAFHTNALGARWVAQAADEMGAAVVYFSTDYVFPGDGGAPYDEWAPTRPLSVYGRSKLAGEAETFRHARRAYVVRTSWVYGGERSFVNTIRRAATRPTLDIVEDEVGGPTLAADLAAAVRRLIEQDVPGLYHLANSGECSRFELARAVVELIGAATTVRPTTRGAYAVAAPGQAPRPAHSTLANRAGAAVGVTLRPWREALAEYLCASR